MQIRDIVPWHARHIQGKRNADVRGIACHSKEVREGDLFVCLPGYHATGGEIRSNTHPFAWEAVQRGATAIICQQPVSVPSDFPVYLVEDSWRALSYCASLFYKNPSDSLNIIGITGTNGKTSVAYMVEKIFQQAEKGVGVISTINRRLPGKLIPSVNTTPEAPVIQEFLRQALDSEIDNVIMEVTSHAIELGRVADVSFRCAVFTNLTHDHLDFHGSLEKYFAAKRKLIHHVADSGGTLIFNLDDSYGRELYQHYRQSNCFGYGINNPEAELTASDLSFSSGNTTFTCSYHGQNVLCRINMLGEHFVSNALAALMIALAHGIDFKQASTALADVTVPGRSQLIRSGTPFQIVVDFAHTPEGMRKALEAARLASPARLITIFGCGGNRDRTKRSLMGRVASELSDHIIVTSDNPRNEEPTAILEDIQGGITTPHVEYIVDRRDAFRHALFMAQPNDLIVILGRGHEPYQMIKGEKIPFSDVDVIEDLIRTKEFV